MSNEELHAEILTVISDQEYVNMDLRDRAHVDGDVDRVEEYHGKVKHMRKLYLEFSQKTIR